MAAEAIPRLSSREPLAPTLRWVLFDFGIGRWAMKSENEVGRRSFRSGSFRMQSFSKLTRQLSRGNSGRNSSSDKVGGGTGSAGDGIASAISATAVELKVEEQHAASSIRSDDTDGGDGAGEGAAAASADIPWISSSSAASAESSGPLRRLSFAADASPEASLSRTPSRPRMLQSQLSIGGTKGYMAPELNVVMQATKGGQGTAAHVLATASAQLDLYSFGMLLKYVLTGVKPKHTHTSMWLNRRLPSLLGCGARGAGAYQLERLEQLSAPAQALVAALTDSTPEKRPSASKCLEHEWLGGVE